MGVAVNDMGILELLTPELLRPQAGLLQRAGVLVVDCNVRPDVLEWLGGEIRHPVLFAEAVSVAKCHKLLPVLGRLHTLKANRMEAQALSGRVIDSIAAACSAALALHQRGVQQVVISLGGEGVAWCDRQGRTGHRAARQVNMLNATGAGDALLSGLVYGHIHSMPLDLAIRFAMACAELTLSSTFANSPALSVDAANAYLEQITT
jgi:pseudouridine kinase